MCRFLEANGIDMNATDDAGDNAMFYAAANGHLETVQYFVGESKKIDIERMYFLMFLHLRVWKTLLKPFDRFSSISFVDVNNEGLSAFDRANDCAVTETALYLWRQGLRGARARSDYVLAHRRVYSTGGIPRFAKVDNVSQIEVGVYEIEQDSPPTICPETVSDSSFYQSWVHVLPSCSVFEQAVYG